MAQRLTPLTTKGDLIVGDTSGNAERIAVGTDGHVLTLDSAQTLGVKWAAASGSSSISQSTQSGDGVTTSFNIAHGLGGTPKVLLTAIGADAAGYAYITVDATNITIVYNIAPASGTNNLKFNWQANL